MLRSIGWGIFIVILLCVGSLMFPIRVSSDIPAGAYVLRVLTWPGYVILETLFPGEWEGVGFGLFGAGAGIAISGALYGFVWESCKRYFQRRL
jgi:hypothetical protein